MSFIVVTSGTRFDLLDVQLDSIRVTDIAASLSKLCRFTGHCNEHYSVAQHCVLGARELPKEHQLAFLLHDASEAYLGDVSKPLKSLLPEYRAIEDYVQGRICEKFGVDYPFANEIKEMDCRMASTEIRDLTNGDIEVWGDDAKCKPLDRIIEPWSWRRAYAEYMVEIKVALENARMYDAVVEFM